MSFIKSSNPPRSFFNQTRNGYLSKFNRHGGTLSKDSGVWGRDSQDSDCYWCKICIFVPRYSKLVHLLLNVAFYKNVLKWKNKIVRRINLSNDNLLLPALLFKVAWKIYSGSWRSANFLFLVFWIAFTNVENSFSPLGLFDWLSLSCWTKSWIFKKLLCCICTGFTLGSRSNILKYLEPVLFQVKLSLKKRNWSTARKKMKLENHNKKHNFNKQPFLSRRFQLLKVKTERKSDFCNTRGITK